MSDINEIAVIYRQHLARLPKHNTRTDYSKRLAMLERWCSMQGITDVAEIDFGDFLDWVFYERGVSARTRNQVDQIHHTNLGGYNFAQAIWSQLKNIPLFYKAIPT